MYIGRVIENIIRAETGNQSYTVDDAGTTTEGISNNLILKFINEAVAFVQSRIIAVYPGEFVAENIQNTVIGQEDYYVEDNTFLNNKFISVEYSRDGTEDRYVALVPASLHDRNTRRGTPYQYIRRNGKILLNHVPDTNRGKLRVNVYRALDRLNIRRGKITAKTLTTFTLSATGLDKEELNNAQYICVVDSYGAVKDYNVKATFNGTDTLTFASQTLNAAIDDYVVTGRYQTTHLVIDRDNPEQGIALSDRILDYCTLFAQRRIYATDSSADEINKRSDVAEVLADIIDQFSEMTEDITDVPILDDSLSG
jgi:hypothetical protein